MSTGGNRDIGGDNQQCIDKATVAALGASRMLPLSSFNWCEG
jgi:hypothetical protein